MVYKEHCMCLGDGRCFLEGCRTEGGLNYLCDLTTMFEEPLLVMQCAKAITADVSQEVKFADVHAYIN